MISDEIIEEIKYKNDIESVVSSYVQVKRRGRNLVGLCPFHSEKTGSFTVYPDNQSFYCFGCGVGGDVVTFIRRIENLEYPEALKLLAERAGIKIEENFDDKTAKLKMRILEINRTAAAFYYKCLTNSYFFKSMREKIMNHQRLIYQILIHQILSACAYPKCRRK